MMVAFVAIVVAVGWLFVRLPTSFLPNEDQGYLIVNVQLPPGATSNRTEAAVAAVENFLHKQPEVADTIGVIGFTFSGQGQNAALVFVPLKPWDERKGKDHSAQALAGRVMGAMMVGVRDAFIFPLSPPPIQELGNATGFALRLQDRAGLGHEALLKARNQLMGMAQKSKLIATIRPDGLEDAPQLQIDIDRDKAQALGVSFDTIARVLGTQLGSAYVNDFPSTGRMQRVVVQADAARRSTPEDVLNLNVTNASGANVPVSAFASSRWITGQMQATRYNGYPAMRLAGDPAAGVSSGQAMAEMENMVAQLPPGIGFEWTGLSREEQLSGSQAGILLALSLLVVFLCLAALYESWSIPLSVMLVVPLGVLGALLGATLRGMPNDVYFKVGLITIIGLSAKNAILIVEFAKDLQAQGKGLVEAILEAARLRLRPIMMTSLAFILGVVPLVIASGAGSGEPARDRHRRARRAWSPRRCWRWSSCRCSSWWCGASSRAASASARCTRMSSMAPMPRPLPRRPATRTESDDDDEKTFCDGRRGRDRGAAGRLREPGPRSPASRGAGGAPVAAGCGRGSVRCQGGHRAAMAEVLPR